MASQIFLTDGHDATDRVPVVSFLGPVSSYTHQAALQRFESEKYDYKPEVTITDVFTAVQNGSSELGVVPFENSTNGAVIFTLELLADRLSQYPDLNVCGEAYLDVRHCLLGKASPHPQAPSSPEQSGACTPTLSSPSPTKPRATPLHNLSHIIRLYSHPQAFGQCEIFLQAYLKGVERIDVSSTSRAAEMVKEDGTGTSASISSSLAAEIHSISILAEGIEDREDNTTRFFILRKGTNHPTYNPPSNSGVAPKTKSLISFTVDHNSPGALAEVLQCFQLHGVNLTSINSRPTREVPFQYIFFVEFEGSKFCDGDGRVGRTLDAVAKYVKSWRWLGSWDDVYWKRK